MSQVLMLKRLVLVFWAVWFSIVFLTNLADAAKGLGLLGETWAFESGNWKLIQETTARYRVPPVVNAGLFAGVIVWEGIAAVLFARAGWSFRGRTVSRRPVFQAFTISLLLWAAFIVADEIFVSYPLESTHLRLFVANLVTLLTVEHLPEE